MIALPFTLPDGSPVKIELHVKRQPQINSILQGEFVLDSNVGLHLRLGRMLRTPWLSFLSSCCGDDAYTFQDGPGECAKCGEPCNASHDVAITVAAVPEHLAEVIALDPVTSLILGHEVHLALVEFFAATETHLQGRQSISLMAA